MSPSSSVNTTETHKKDKKSKKKDRAATVAQHAMVVEVEEPEQEEIVVEKKKKKKDKKRKRELEDVDQLEQDDGEVDDVDANIDPVLKKASPAKQAQRPAQEPPAKKKKNKSKKDKQAADQQAEHAPVAMQVDEEQDELDEDEPGPSTSDKRPKKEKKSKTKSKKKTKEPAAEPVSAPQDSESSSEEDPALAPAPLPDAIEQERNARKLAKKEKKRLAAEKKVKDASKADEDERKRIAIDALMKRLQGEKSAAASPHAKASASTAASASTPNTLTPKSTPAPTPATNKKKGDKGKGKAVEAPIRAPEPDILVSTPVIQAQSKPKPKKATKSAPAPAAVVQTSTSSIAVDQDDDDEEPVLPELDDDDESSDDDVDALIQNLMVSQSASKPKVAKERAPRATKAKGRKKAEVDSEGQDEEEHVPYKSSGRHHINGMEGIDPVTLLQTRWLTNAQLKLLVADRPGFWYNSGRFTRTEDETITRTIDTYRHAHDLTEDEMKTIITTPRLKKQADEAVSKLMQSHERFWFDLADALERRPLMSLYAHTRRMYDPLARQGPWTAEQDKALMAAFKQHGANWKRVGEDVGRAGFDCQDRYKKQLAVSPRRRGGKWDDGEVQKLRAAVTKFGKHWNLVCAEVSGRSAAQCMVKWTDDIERRDALAAGVHNPRPEDKANLVHAVSDLNVKDETEIDFNKLTDPVLKGYPNKSLTDRWRRLLEKANMRLKEGDPSKEYSHSDKLKWLLERYPVKGQRKEPSWMRRERKNRAKKVEDGEPKKKSDEYVDSDDDNSTESDDDDE